MSSGLWSSRTVLVLEDISRTNLVALASTILSSRTSLDVIRLITAITLQPSLLPFRGYHYQFCVTLKHLPSGARCMQTNYCRKFSNTKNGVYMTTFFILLDWDCCPANLSGSTMTQWTSVTVGVRLLWSTTMASSKRPYYPSASFTIGGYDLWQP